MFINDLWLDAFSRLKLSSIYIKKTTSFHGLWRWRLQTLWIKHVTASEKSDWYRTDLSFHPRRRSCQTDPPAHHRHHHLHQPDDRAFYLKVREKNMMAHWLSVEEQKAQKRYFSAPLFTISLQQVRPMRANLYITYEESCFWRRPVSMIGQCNSHRVHKSGTGLK